MKRKSTFSDMRKKIIKNTVVIPITTLLFSFFFFSYQVIEAQNDFPPAADNIVFKEGVYIDFNSLLSAQPINCIRIIDCLDDNLKEVLKKKELEYLDDMGIKKLILTDDVWGYAEKGALFVQINKEFHRITMIGTISHLFVNQKVYRSGMNDPYNYNYGSPMYSPTYETDQLVQYLIDFKTGMVLPMELSTLESLISSDNELYTEFVALKKRQKKQMMLMYIRRFNERNPLKIAVK